MMNLEEQIHLCRKTNNQVRLLIVESGMLKDMENREQIERILMDFTREITITMSDKVWELSWPLQLIAGQRAIIRFNLEESPGASHDSQ